MLDRDCETRYEDTFNSFDQTAIAKNVKVTGEGVKRLVRAASISYNYRDNQSGCYCSINARRYSNAISATTTLAQPQKHDKIISVINFGKKDRITRSRAVTSRR